MKADLHPVAQQSAPEQSTAQKLKSAADRLVSAGANPEATAAVLERVNRIVGALNGHTKLPDDTVEAIHAACRKDLIGTAGFVPWAGNPEDNLLACLDRIGAELRLNERANHIEGRRGGDAWEYLDDHRRIRLKADVARQCLIFPKIDKNGMGPIKHALFSRTQFEELLSAIAFTNRTDPFREWLECLPEWDGQERLEHLIDEFFHTPETTAEFSRWAMRCVFLGAVGRAFKPGKQHDETIILVGGQGVGKSSFWSHLLPHEHGWFSDNLYMNTKDPKSRIEAITGMVLVECAEMSGFTRAEIADTKAFLTRQVDQYRMPYDRVKSRLLRQSIIVGSTNDRNSLPNDPTGLRRFHPIVVLARHGQNAARIRSALPKLHEQLWAEAVYLYQQDGYAGIPESLIPEAQTVAEEHRRRDTALEEAVEAYLADQDDDAAISLAHLLKSLEVSVDRTDTAQKAKTILETHGFTEQRVRRTNPVTGKQTQPRLWIQRDG